MKLLIFIRDEIWNIKEDRKTLETYLKSNTAINKEIEGTEINDIVHHSSNLINDAENIFSFIDEVCRKDEMIDAIAAKGEFPKNNWVHPFKSFKDIVDVINNEFKLNTPINELTLRHNLRIELLTNIQSMLEKNDDNVRKSNLWAKFCRDAISKNLDTPSVIPYKYLKWLSMYAWVLPGKQHTLRTYFVEQAISTGLFLQFNNKKSVYEDTDFSKYLRVLRIRISSFSSLIEFASEHNVKLLQKYGKLKGTPSETEIQIDNLDILPFLALHDRAEDIINISKALFNYLDGNSTALNSLQLCPDSPFEDETEKMANERPTVEETMDWLSK